MRLVGAQIGSQLSFDGAHLTNPLGSALSLDEAEVPRSLWIRFAEKPEGAVNLQSARIGALYDSEETWPRELGLRGFTYDRLEALPEVPVKGRLAWLERDPSGYAPQPYEQLVAVYRRTGQEEDARRVAIEKQRRRRREFALRRRRRSLSAKERALAALSELWSVFLGATVGPGYRAWLAGVWLLVLFVVGSVVFDLAYPEHFKPAKRVGEIPAFQPLYTLDLILPVINLRQRDAWIAQGPAQWGALLSVAGWVLATAAVAALTGLLKRD